jgi:hypothetical protein
VYPSDGTVGMSWNWLVARSPLFSMVEVVTVVKAPTLAEISRSDDMGFVFNTTDRKKNR